MREPRKHRFLPALVVAALVPLVFSLGSARATPSELFFSEYIEGSSNNKALEIFNGTGGPIDLDAGEYSVQMFFNGNPSAGLTIGLDGVVGGNDVFVLAHSSASTEIQAQADQTNGAGWFNGDDAVVLRKGSTIIDAIGVAGQDPGTEWGSGLTSTADNTLRRKATIQTGDPNASDSFDPAVEWNGFDTNDASDLGSHTIVEGDAAPAVSSTTPAGGAAEVPLDADVTVTFGEPVDVAASWFSISCATSGAHAATESGGPETFTLDPDADFAPDESCTVTVHAAQVTDRDADDPPDAMAADFAFSFRTIGPPTRIHEIQGASHTSPLVGERASRTPGIVTAKTSSGFWFQDPAPDGDPSTSEGLFVFGSAAAARVTVGDAVEVSGNIVEFRPGGSGSANLTTTELTSPFVTVRSSGNALPAPTVVGAGGRVPPAEVIDDDSAGSVETSGVFDPAEDGIDFYESLEGMRLRVDDALAVGPRNGFGEIPVVGDGGAAAGPRTARGGVVIAPGDFNPERIMLDDTLRATPVVDLGDGFTTPVVGVLDYSFGNFKLNVTAPLTAVDGGLEREVTAAPADQEIAVATYNVENLDPGDGPAFARHAEVIVDHLRAPDLIAIEEVQDNDGQADTGTTDASLTWSTLIAAIQAAGGPVYDYRQIDPLDNEDGGAPGGNIRVGFLFRTDRGLSVVDRPGGDATTATTVVEHPSGPQLSPSPGRIEPTSPAFVDTRKSLALELRARGKKLFAVVNHFSSKGGDDPLFGRFQPPTRHTEVARHQQAQVVNEFVDEILAADPNANVVVLGDINDFEFSETVEILEGGVLTTLMDTLPKAERYSYVFEGNSQVLDQILLSENLLEGFPFAYDVVHVNSEFADQTSDHEPQVARLDLAGRPTPK
ncbi:MAG TPA: Ig-like domain-containing protein [Gaiellaceae bacterium]|nr:Ig-like domain-containing protein [Gaiellaceae bacterium]